jgi:hypothetical protein
MLEESGIYIVVKRSDVQLNERKQFSDENEHIFVSSSQIKIQSGLCHHESR